MCHGIDRPRRDGVGKPSSPGTCARSSIARELGAQLAIGYTPTNDAHDGGYRRITVEIPGRPGVRARTRAGDTADGPIGAQVQAR